MARNACAALLIASPVGAEQWDSGLIPEPVVLMPQVADVRAEVFLLSDNSGWSDAEAALAAALRADGVIVIGVDLPAYLRALADAPGSGCVYLVSDIEKLSHQVQRAAGNPEYRLPTVAGIGAGGALALAIAAQTPAATIGGTVALDPTDRIDLSRPLCTPATRDVTPSGTSYELTLGPLPDPVTVLFTPTAPDAGRTHVADLAKTWPAIVVESVDADRFAALQQALTPTATPAGPAEGRLADLPLTVLDAQPTKGVMAVIYSGDGGWRDLDKTIGGDLQASGVPVVGVDSLQYFWSLKTPAETAADLTAIIDTYRAKWGVGAVILAGYSFGADILPATFLGLDAAHQSVVRQVSLLGLSRTASFEISVAGWMGLQSGTQSTLDDLHKIAPHLVQCFYGAAETDSACPDLAGTGADLIQTSGGHHFDGNYAALADRILAGPSQVNQVSPTR